MVMMMMMMMLMLTDDDDVEWGVVDVAGRKVVRQQVQYHIRWDQDEVFSSKAVEQKMDLLDRNKKKRRIKN